MSPWGWKPERTQGIWRHGALWLKPLAVLSPWATGVICLMLMYLVGDALTAEKGLLFDLPDPGAEEGEATSLVALVMPLRRESTVYFDDARYTLSSGTSAAALGEHLMERVAHTSKKTLLVLADRRIPYGDLAQFAVLARASGIEKVLLANKRTEERGE